jgi:uncharacterized membrane protein YGL010W
MISIETVVWFVIYMLGAGLIFGLLVYLINYVSEQFPSMAPFAKFAKIGLMICAVLILIGVVLQFMGHPIIRFVH